MTHVAPNAVSPGPYAPPTPASAQTPRTPLAADVRASTLRLLAYSGFVAAITIIAGIVAVSMIPDQMAGNSFEKTIAEIIVNHRAEVAAGWLFAVGLGAVVPFTWMLVRTLDDPVRTRASVGATIITLGATVNIVGSMAMVAVGHALVPILRDPATHAAAAALLGVGVSLDAMYNLSLGIGMLLVGTAMRAGGSHGVWPRWSGTLAVVVGVLSLPVAFEWYSQTAALVQFASGTLYLVWAIAVSVMALRHARA